MSKPIKTGKLRIGDQWNAITIIARSQTHILKAVCELVENSIDAGARRIEIIRRKSGKEPFLEVTDDGKGLKVTDEGIPDFQYVATHICDSLKRYLKSHERDGIHGEFGIGLLGFWGLGKTLTMTAHGSEGRAFQMTMKSGAQSYSITAVPGSMVHKGGVKVTIGPLHPTTRNILTGDRLDKYLASELRDRIKQTGVIIEIFDRIAHKNRRVVPREFEGDKLADIKDMETEHGIIKVELYLTSPNPDAMPVVSLSKDGTRVKKDMAELESFDHRVWRSGSFTGNIDCPFLNLTPGTRDSVIHDACFDSFITVMQQLEDTLETILKSLEQTEAEKASEQISRDVKKAFTAALSELPTAEYLWFDIESPDEKKAGEIPGTGEDGGMDAPKKDKPSAMPSFLDMLPGDPAMVKITPRMFSVLPSEHKTINARVYDEKNIEVKDDVAVQWSIKEGSGTVAQHLVESQAIYYAPQEPGTAVVEATIIKGQWQGSAEESENGVSVGKGLPNYRLLADVSGAWRSRYLPQKNIIEINSAHRDFSASKGSFAMHRRYIGKLYAKEIVLLNFPGTSQNETLERLVEVLVRIEKLL